jgi:Creatinase/Prolidase N-terminal domain
MDTPSTNLRAIRSADIDPRFNWDRHLPALGTMAVDFEERVNYRRLHDYRIGRAREALDASELGTLLVFDVNNIRYLTSTKIGEWERGRIMGGVTHGNRAVAFYCSLESWRYRRRMIWRSRLTSHRQHAA